MSDSALTAQVDRLAEALLGTCDHIDHVVEKLELELLEGRDHIEDLLLDSGSGVEVCAGCGWWFESFDLDGDMFCVDCGDGDDDD